MENENEPTSNPASPTHKPDGTIEFGADVHVDPSSPDGLELQRRADEQEKVTSTITAEDVRAAKISQSFKNTVGINKASPQVKDAVAEAIARVTKIRDAQRANVTYSADAPDGVVDGDGPVRFGTAPTDNYLPTYGISPILTVVTPGGSPATWTAQGVEDYTPPPREYQNHNDVTLTGSLAGKQLVTITVEKSSMIQLTQIYGTKHYAYLDPLIGVNYCVITLTLNDGSIYAGVGGITKATPSQQSDNNSLKTAITIVMNGGWTYTVGTTGPANA